MVSAIDPTKPIDGVPAVKGDLRDNLQAAKSEIEAIQTKISHTINLASYSGADPTGISDSTSALQTAIDEIIAYSGQSGPNKIKLSGSYLLDPSNLDLSSVSKSNNIVIEFDGLITLSNTFEYGPGMHLTGVSGSSDAQFGILPKSSIVFAGPSTDPVLNLVDDGGSCSLQNVYIRPQDTHNAPAILLGYENGAPTQDQSALFYLRNVSVLCGNQANSTALTLENAFWVWVEDFALNAQTNAKASIHLADSYDPGVGRNASGLVQIENGVITGKGILCEGDDVDVGHVVLKHVHYESCLNDFITIDKASGIRTWGFTIENLGFADNLVTDPAFFNIVNPGTLTDLTIINNPNFTGARLFKGNAPDFAWINQVSRINRGAADRNFFAPYCRKGVYVVDGEQEAISAFRGGDFRPSFVPTECTILPIDYDSGVWNLSGSPTVTAGQTAPDGSATAVLFTTATAGVHVADIAPDQSNTIASVGDRILFGAWFKPESGRRVSRSGGPMRMGATAGTPWEETASGIFQPEFDRAQEVSETWVMLSSFATVDNVPAGAYRFSLELNSTATGFYIWQPFWIVVPASWPDRDVVRLQNSLPYIPKNAVKGTLTCLENQPFKTGSDTTANRPSASSAGQGAQFYDTTLGKPIWSNGSTWTGGGAGYIVGQGDAVTQGTSRTTGVTLNAPTGEITLVSAAGSATAASFTVTNSEVDATDTVIVSQKSGADKYQVLVTAVAAGSFEITFFTTGGTTTEQPVFNFTVVKGAAS